MIYSWCLIYFVIAVKVHGALEEKTPCPRKRGLSDGLTWAWNRIQRRALYRLNVRKASRGYIPEEIYKFRIHTTYKKRKFDDASVFLEALDSRCGAGTFIIEDPNIFSPKGCPDIVATKTKQPMGRADILWQAPQCGCVNIRVRIHSNQQYFLDDEDTEAGPLSRTVCPKDRNLWNFPERLNSHFKAQLSRQEKLQQLCDIDSKFNASDVAKSERFSRRRNVDILTEFERDRLETAMELRSTNTKHCCEMEDGLRIECFGDIRRRRIDSFCGTGETDIPLLSSRLDWITDRESECCWQIGEERYHCFDYTSNEKMLRDGQTDPATGNEISLDEFDPVNDIEDYPVNDDHHNVQAQDIETAPSNTEVQHNENDHSQALKNDSSERDEEHKHSKLGDKIQESSEESHELEDKEDDEQYPTDSGESEEDSQTSEEIDRDRELSKEECCYNGITAGTRVADEGMLGCFRIAELFSSVFTKWNNKCDRRFVVCCMRVVDGLKRRRHGTPEFGGVLFPHGERPSKHTHKHIGEQVIR